jgi:DNA polymerase-3 subunit gamma/tau
MRGTTAPRLHLELMCARVLLPEADLDDRGIHARIDRLERRIGVTSTSSASAATTPQPESAPSTSTAGVTPVPSASEITPPAPRPELGEGRPEQISEAPTATTQPPQLTVADVRRLWPEVLEEVKGKRRFTWILLSQNAQVAELRSGTLLLAMSNAGARDSFARGGSEDVLREAMVVVMGADFTIETMVDPSATPSSAARTQWPTAQASATPVSAPESPTTRATNGARHDTADDPDAIARRDDSDLVEDQESQTELLARHLGAEIIAEEDHGA